MNIKELFGTNLRKFRTQKEYSQEKFAELCGLHRTNISDQKIAEALEIKTYMLLVDEKENNA